MRFVLPFGSLDTKRRRFLISGVLRFRHFTKRLFGCICAIIYHTIFTVWRCVCHTLVVVVRTKFLHKRAIYRVFIQIVSVKSVFPFPSPLCFIVIPRCIMHPFILTIRSRCNATSYDYTPRRFRTQNNNNFFIVIHECLYIHCRLFVQNNTNSNIIHEF